MLLPLLLPLLLSEFGEGRWMKHPHIAPPHTPHPTPHIATWLRALSRAQCVLLPSPPACSPSPKRRAHLAHRIVAQPGLKVCSTDQQPGRISRTDGRVVCPRVSGAAVQLGQGGEKACGTREKGGGRERCWHS